MVSENEKSTCFPLGEAGAFGCLGGRVCGRGRGVSSVMCFVHDSSFCGRSRGGFRLCGVEAGAFRSPPPPLRSRTYKLVLCPTLAGRGGSVSRRDHNQAYRRQKALSGGTNYEGATSLNASHSSGEGVWGRGASLREVASPPEFPLLVSSGGSAREGASLQRSPLPRIPRLSFAYALVGRWREEGLCLSKGGRRQM